MLIVTEDFVQAGGAAVGASSAETEMPGSNLRVLQPSVRWRTATIANTPYVEANLEGNPVGSINLGYDAVAIVGYDGAPSRNLLRDSLLLASSAYWAATNALVSSALVDPPAGLPFRVWQVSSDGGGASHLEQTIQKPGKGSDITGTAAISISVLWIFRQNDDVDDVDLRLIVYSTISTQEVQADFDLSAGTASAGSAAGAFTLDAAPDVIDLGDGYFACRLQLTTDTADTVTFRAQLLTGAGSTSVPAGDSLFGGAPVALLQEYDQGVTEYPLTVHTGTGLMWRVRLAYGSIFVGEVVSSRTEWMSAATRNRLRAFDRFSFFHRYPSLHSEDHVRVELWDPSNALGYIEAGRLIVGRALELKGIATAHGLFEQSGEARADGGQVYRSQGEVTRAVALTMRYEDKATAYDELHLLRRIQGRSRQVLVVADQTDPLYMQEGMVYGYIDDLPPMPVSGGRRRAYRFPMTIVETI